ncbi:MAG: hypothetical protein ACE5FI_07065 [Anaerolineales bacterium]
MMRIRCQYCSWMVVLKPGEMAAGIASARDSKSPHYVLNCPKCRRALKVSVKQMRRQLPPGFEIPAPADAAPATAADADAAEEPESTSADE